MKLSFDKESDALYLQLDDSAVIESEEVQPGIVFDFNQRNEVIGIEILHVRKRFPAAHPEQLQEIV